MAADLTPREIIVSALRLPLSEREQVVEILQESLIDTTIDHGPEDSTDEVRAAWGDEIARRIAELDSENIKTIPADDAERMIRGRERPSV